MNTNNIKSFAQQARLLLLEGVRQRLMYWGFDAKGNNSETLETTHGGYIFRGEIHTDSTVPEKWNALRKRLTDKQSVNDVIEEAAYTWFNRLMAIKILEENQYLDPTLQFAEGVHTPMLVQNAKQGNHTITSTTNRNLLIDLLKENQEEQAFALLITDLCNKNRLLHDVFGRINDYTELLLPHNILQKDGLMDLINNGHIEKEDYKEVELIGWLYQFYISDKKDEVFASFKKNKKARAEDIPAATQIFTPKWIVKYMVENTVGKIYLDYETDSALRSDMKYLVENDSDKNSTPIIDDITELTLLDPACGSGHILVTGFELLFEMYMEAGYTARNAVANILKHNLYGLDIDDRAMQLARFAVLLKGAELLKGNGNGISVSREFMTNPTLIPHIYSFAEEQHFESEELQSFLGANGQQYSAELKDTLTLLNQGKNIGSALKIDLSHGAVTHIEKQYKDWQQKQQNSALVLQQTGIWNRLQPMIDVLLVLAKKYSAVVANPPYMGFSKYNPNLKSYINTNYLHNKGDLCTVFMDVCYNLIGESGKYSMINQNSWTYKTTYHNLRENIHRKYLIENMLDLGPGTFDELSGEVVQSTCFVISNAAKKTKKIGCYFDLNESRNSKEKEILFHKIKSNPFYFDLKHLTNIPGYIIAYWISENGLFNFSNNKPLSFYGDVKIGLSTGQDKRFLRLWFELSHSKIKFYFKLLSDNIYDHKWFPLNKGGGFRRWSGNFEYAINWENDGYQIRNFRDKKGKLRSRPQNISYFFKDGITYNIISSKGFVGRLTSNPAIMSDVGPTIYNLEDKEYILALLSSKVGNYFFKVLCPGYKFDTGAVGKFPVIKQLNIFDKKIVKRNEKISKYDWDSRETSWDFKQSPLLNESSSLKDAYKLWEKDVTKDFFQLHSNEVELNRIFIDIYGLQDELTPEVALKDITILQDELDRKALEELEPLFREQGKEAITLPISKEEVISQFISYAIGVFMGRYRLDKPGLNIAHPNPTEEETASYEYNGHTINIDEDGVIPLMGRDCAFPDDALNRVTDLIHAIWGEESLTENINFIHNALGVNLHRWLTERFWKYHTSGKMYKKKPIYWLFSSNVSRPQNAAFKVLVYMHRMDKYTVNKIQRKYLYPHQEYISREIERLVANEANLSRDDLKQLEQLRKWEIECRDYSEVLKELANKEIAFDLDDGVTENYTLFEGAVANI